MSRNNLNTSRFSEVHNMWRTTATAPREADRLATHRLGSAMRLVHPGPRKPQAGTAPRGRCTTCPTSTGCLEAMTPTTRGTR
eukprot:scaffold84076_cov47-Prasinocladus_malaysianus.AAC.3